jgi:hypothetical protein
MTGMTRERLVLLQDLQNFLAVLFREVEIEKYQVWVRGLDVSVFLA